MKKIVLSLLPLSAGISAHAHGTHPYVPTTHPSMHILTTKYNHTKQL